MKSSYYIEQKYLVFLLSAVFLIVTSSYAQNSDSKSKKLHLLKAKLAKEEFFKSYNKDAKGKKTVNLGNLYAGLSVLSGEPDSIVCELISPLDLKSLKRRSAVERKRRNLATNVKLIARIVKRINILTFKIIGARYITDSCVTGFTSGSRRNDNSSITLKAADANVGHVNSISYWGDYIELSAINHDGSQGTIVFGWGGLAVSGGRFDKQLDYQVETNSSEQLDISFLVPVTNISLELSRMAVNEYKEYSESGLWRAYNTDNQLIGEGTFTPSDSISKYDTFTFDINLESEIKKLSVSAIPYGNNPTIADERADNSDFNISSISFKPNSDYSLPKPKIKPTVVPTTIPESVEEDNNSEKKPEVISPIPNPVSNKKIILQGKDVKLNKDFESASWGDNVTISAYQPNQTPGIISKKKNTVGVFGNRTDTLIDFDPEYGASESLEIKFKEDVFKVNLIITDLIENEVDTYSETGVWHAYSRDGLLINKGKIDSKTGKKITSSKYKVAIKTKKKIASIIITASPYNNGEGINYFNENSDFGINQLSFFME